MHGTINLDRSEPLLDGRNLDALVQRWLDDRADALGAGTVIGYGSKIAHFRLLWASYGPRQYCQMTRSDLLRFL